MGTSKSGLSGDVTGSIGSVYFRKVYGKTVISHRPGSRRTPKDERSQEIFTITKKLAVLSKGITFDSEFYEMWKHSELKGPGPYHKFFHLNHPHDGHDVDYDNIKLTPFTSGFHAEINSVEVLNSMVNISFKPLGNESGINPSRELYLNTGGILLGTNPKHKGLDKLRIIMIKSVPVQTDLAGMMSFELTAFDNTKYLIQDFGSIRVIVFLFTLNSELKMVRTSATITFNYL